MKNYNKTRHFYGVKHKTTQTKHEKTDIPSRNPTSFCIFKKLSENPWQRVFGLFSYLRIASVFCFVFLHPLFFKKSKIFEKKWTQKNRKKMDAKNRKKSRYYS